MLNFAGHQFSTVMKKQILATESFASQSKRHYFLDFKRADNNSNYIQITRSEQQEDNSYKRWQIIVFENDFEQFIQAFASLFQSAAYQGGGFETVKQIQEQVKSAKGIKRMEPDQRPREKMIAHGAEDLTTAELLAMLIGSGTPNQSAVDLAENILKGFNDNPGKFKTVKLEELCKFKGMGIAKSSSILAAVELARRIYEHTPPVFKPIYIFNRPGKDLGLLLG